MIETPQTNMLQVELLAHEIVARLKGVESGHCARVDFLDRAEAQRICYFISQQQLAPGVAFHILVSNDAYVQNSAVFITTDKAIELRNRKQQPLCLFIPSDLVDAAFSSIANSFALIDGRALHALILERVRAQLSTELQVVVRAVFARLRGLTGVSDEQRLDFALALLRRMESGETTQLGLELWRVGLIADAGGTFVSRLDNNRDCVLNLSRPNKLGATTRERVQSIKVDMPTTNALAQFFHGRAMNDVRAWSRDLADNHYLTFDRWAFPETDHSDLRSVSITRFTKDNGEVEPYCHLRQPDGAKGILLARYGAKDTIVVRWKTEPVQPKEVSRWRIGIVPSDSKKGFEECVDERSVLGSRRTTTIKLDMDFDEPLDYGVCFRIVPLNADGNEIINQEKGEAFYADSHEFFLVPGIDSPPPEPPRKSLRTVPTLAFGRLEVAVDMRETVLAETEPEWINKDLKYFRLRLNDRRIVNIGLSYSLWDLQTKILAEARSGGCFILNVDEVRPVDRQNFTLYPLSSGNAEAWQPFWRAREAFFKRLKQSDVRNVIETVDWTSDLAASALRYAQVYSELIEDLVSHRADTAELREAFSIDSLLIRNTGNGELAEEAIVILPTHPLRAAWFASYAQLLHEWEKQLLEYKLRERKRSIDLQSLRLLVPTNVPAFAYHAAATTTAFSFFQNLRFFHGIALPADVPDPHRRFGDIALILDTGIDQVGVGDIQPDQLAEHLKKFHQSHPYAETLVTTLINPDRGDFFAEAIKKMLFANNTSDEPEQLPSLPAFQIISYAADKHKSTFQALEQVRQQQSDQRIARNSDHFLPSLTTTARAMSQLEKTAPPEAHIAVVTDFTRPAIVASPVSIDSDGADTSSFSLYGLINRFISQFTSGNEGLLWRHRIVTEGVRKPEPHPAGPRYSETLMELHTTLLNAGGYLLGGPAGSRPVLEVQLTAGQRNLLESLHINTNWVITLDRFFTLDYYDSPHQPGLDEVARKYVLDYSPEFTEGLGHRMMVTTAWHEEIGSLLGQAMDELGFSNIDTSVSHLLHYLKTISGRLALDALESSTNAAAAVGLGVVTAWLQKNNRLRQAVLVPVDIYPRLFSQEGSGRPSRGERRCDLMLVSLRRNIVDATFIEVKWRRGRMPLEELAHSMVLQMAGSAQAMKNRFFDASRDDGNVERVDGALQRSYLANVLRFYFERSRRYNLFDPEAESTFLEHLTRLEKTGLAFRPNYEGYIVSLDNEPRKPLLLGDAKIIVLTAANFEDEAELIPSPTRSTNMQSWAGSATFEYPTDKPLIEQESVPDQVAVESATQPLQRDGSHVSPDPEPVDIQNDSDATEIVIPLGETLGERVDWKPGVKGSPHLFILGIPGQGKSWTTTRILSELGRQHVPALVLDFHGQFAELEETHIKAISPNVLDAAQGLPFSPFECARDNGQSGWMANALAVAEIFAYVAGLGEMQKDIVYTSVRDAYKALGFDDDNADDLAAMLEYPTLKDVLKRIEQNEQIRHVTNVAARCRPLLEMDLFRPGEKPADLLSLVRNGLVIDLHNLFAETLQMATGAFVLRKLYKDMFHWGYAKHLRLAIVLDEAHRLAKDITLPKLMKEGRKFGISVIVASQGIGDFHPDVLSNAGTKTIFRMNYPESRKVAGFIRGRPGQDLSERIEQLAVGSAYVQTPDMMYGSVVKMYPPK